MGQGPPINIMAKQDSTTRLTHNATREEELTIGQLPVSSLENTCTSGCSPRMALDKF